MLVSSDPSGTAGSGLPTGVNETLGPAGSGLPSGVARTLGLAVVEVWGWGCLRPILESLRFSSSASCNRTDQDGRTSQGQSLSGATSQDVSNLEFSGFSIFRYRAGQGVTDTAHVQGAKLRESSNPSPIRFSPPSRVSISAMYVTLDPLGHQQPAGESAQASCVEGRRYYTQVIASSQRPSQG